MQLPSQLLDSLKDLAGFDKEAFEKVHLSGERVTSVRLNPSKWPVAGDFSFGLPLAERVPWTENAYYLSERPSFTFDPLFHAGCYYVQEASSMFIEQAIKQKCDLSQPLRILDLCAAPGGKSTHIQSLISPESLLVSNEAIRSRSHILTDNIARWGAENVIVTHNDPRDFSELENYFDILVVDAPCSGSGLFRRDPEAVKEWSLNHVQLCSHRQQRILADSWPALKKNGLLIYSTCSYSKEEDEEICQWMHDQFSVLPKPLLIREDWPVTKSSAGYRFWPDQVKGEGFFLAVMEKTEGGERASVNRKNKPEQLSGREVDLVSKWVKTGEKTFLKRGEHIYAIQQSQVNDLAYLAQKLRLNYSGVGVGELIKEKLVPDHALALSCITTDQVNRVELGREDAVRYLQRKEIQVQPDCRGWQLVTYLGFPLGWVNVLSNRVNNYYPRELRILKDLEPGST